MTEPTPLTQRQQESLSYINQCLSDYGSPAGLEHLGIIIADLKRARGALREICKECLEYTEDHRWDAGYRNTAIQMDKIAKNGLGE